MLYLSPASTAPVREAIRSGRLGQIVTPLHVGAMPGVRWAADNGCFNEDTYAGDDQWFAWLLRQPVDGMLFATAPDVVGDAHATMARSWPWLAKVRESGRPVAYVAQDGATPANLPWDDFDVLFVGGSTAWKLGRDARLVVAEARKRGAKPHMGRVNSERRYRYADAIGCHSVDGTFVTFGPNIRLPELLGWQRKALLTTPRRA